MNALEARSRLTELETERAAAQASPLAHVGTYMADLHDEISRCRQFYVGAAVTEIASLRAELFGPQYG